MALTGSGAGTAEQLRSFLEQGEHDVFAHYVTKEDSLKAAVEGSPIMALCGKVWVPYRNPDSYPVCPTCLEIAEEILDD
jgi:hypothetical protein